MYFTTGECVSITGKNSKVKSFHQEAIEIWDSLGKPASKAIASTLNSYISLEVQLQHLKHAKELLDLLMAMIDKTLGPADPERAAVYNSNATYYEAVGKIGNALEMYKKALDAWELAGWPNHSNLLIAYKNHANLLNKEKKFCELESILPRAIEKCQDMLGKNSCNEAIFWNKLGVATGSQGKHDDAMHNFKNALAIWKAMNWPKDDGVNVVHTNLYSEALTHSNFKIVVSTAESALAYVRKHYGNQHPALVGRLNNLGVAYREWRKFDKAANYFEQAIQIVNCTLGPDHIELPTVLSNYARLRKAQESSGKPSADREEVEPESGIGKHTV